MVLLTVRTHGRNKRENVIHRAHARSKLPRLLCTVRVPCVYAHGHNCPRILFTVRAPIVQVTAIIYHAWSNVLIKNY